MELERRCSAQVYKPREAPHQCLNKAVIVRGGKSYCKIHDPEYIAQKDHERWKKAWIEGEKQHYRRQVLAGIFEGVDTATIVKLAGGIRQLITKCEAKE